MHPLHGSTCSHCMGAHAAIAWEHVQPYVHRPSWKSRTSLLAKICGAYAAGFPRFWVARLCCLLVFHLLVTHTNFTLLALDMDPTLCAHALRYHAVPGYAQCHAMRNAMPCAMHFGRRWEVWWSSVCCSMAAVSAETTADDLPMMVIQIIVSHAAPDLLPARAHLDMALVCRRWRDATLADASFVAPRLEAAAAAQARSWSMRLPQDTVQAFVEAADEDFVCRVARSSDALVHKVLVCAATCGRAPLVHRLLAAPAGSHDRRAHADAHDSSALQQASKQGHADVVRLLLDPAVAGEEHRAHASDRNGMPLLEAASRGHADVVRLLLDVGLTGEEHRVHADAGDSFALRWAAHEGRADVVRLLLDPAVAGEAHRARADAHDSDALRAAAGNGHADIVRLLLDPAFTGEEHRARADDGGSLALLVAAENGHTDVVRLLLDPAVAGEKHRARADANGSKALTRAIAKGHRRIQEMLLDPTVAGRHHARRDT